MNYGYRASLNHQFQLTTEDAVPSKQVYKVTTKKVSQDNNNPHITLRTCRPDLLFKNIQEHSKF